MKLYHYLHCPFCVRIRLVLGFLNISYDSIILDYDDEQTPLKMIGKKMLPILQKTDSSFLSESLDIIKYLDKEAKLGDDKGEVDDLLNELGKSVHPLAMPYWIYTPEFNESSRQYFRAKKEAYKGPFTQFIAKKDQYLSSLNVTLNTLKHTLKPFYKSDNLSIYDILIAAHLWGMYIVPEFQFDSEIHQYLQSIKTLCKFDYHEGIWN